MKKKKQNTANATAVLMLLISVLLCVRFVSVRLSQTNDCLAFLFRLSTVCIILLVSLTFHRCRHHVFVWPSYDNNFCGNDKRIVSFSQKLTKVIQLNSEYVMILGWLVGGSVSRFCCCYYLLLPLLLLSVVLLLLSLRKDTC